MGSILGLLCWGVVDFLRPTAGKVALMVPFACAASCIAGIDLHGHDCVNATHHHGDAGTAVVWAILACAAVVVALFYIGDEEDK
mgnify:CR=1 FL=1|jgi:hypothetical protein